MSLCIARFAIALPVVLLIIQYAGSEELTVKAFVGGSIAQPANESTTHNTGDEVVIEAVPNPGFYFTGWTGDGVENVASKRSARTTVALDVDSSLIAAFSPLAGIKNQNGDFSAGMANWTAWTVNGTVEREIDTEDGSLSLRGNGFNGGVYQQFDTGGVGNVVTVTGYWRSQPTTASSAWAEISVINSGRTPAGGVDETPASADVVRMFRNSDSNGWDGAIPHNSLDEYQISFIAESDTATVILKAGNEGGGVSSVAFDNIEVRSVLPPASITNLPPGFESRRLIFRSSGMDRIAEHPITHDIYSIRDFGNYELYKIDVSADVLDAELVANIGQQGIEFDSWSAGLTFDPAGNAYIISHDGDLIKGTYDANTDSYEWSSFLDINDTYNIRNVGDHGFGGLAVDAKTNTLYINYGAVEHGDGNSQPEPDNGLNIRILRVGLDGSNFGVHSMGTRHCFGLTVRSDGSLFGVENSTDCHSAERFLFLRGGKHYGFPYVFSSDRSGTDSGLFTCEETPVIGGPFSPALANYGPDARPSQNQPGYLDGGVYWGFHPHSSPNGVDFYETAFMDPDAILFPEEYHERAFIVRFGRQVQNSPDVGFDLISLRMDEANGSFVCNTFLSSVGRLVHVLCHTNGKLYFLAYTPVTSGAGVGTANSRLYEVSYTIPSKVELWKQH